MQQVAVMDQGAYYDWLIFSADFENFDTLFILMFFLK